MRKTLGFVSALFIILSSSIYAEVDQEVIDLMNAIKNKNHHQLQYLVNKGSRLEARDGEGDTALTKAVKERNLEAVKILLNASADPMISDSAGNKATKIAFEKNFDNIFKLLTFFHEKRTEFISAVKNGNIEQVKKSILNGLNVNLTNSQGQTPLMIAAWFGHINMLKELIILGGQLYRDDSQGNNVFTIIASRGDEVAKQILINYGVDKKHFVVKFSVPTEVQQYGLSHRQLLFAKKVDYNVEQLYEGGKYAASKLIPILKEMEVESFEMSKALMSGFKIFRGEQGVLAFPDPLYFAQLSSLKGAVADKEFFKLQAQTKPELLPVYVKQQSAKDGCILYGHDMLTRLFGDWRAYQKKYPQSYKSEVENQLKGLQETFLGNMCACEGENSVVNEFKAFIKAKIDPEISKKLKKRLDNIRKKKSTIEFNCKPNRKQS